MGAGGADVQNPMTWRPAALRWPAQWESAFVADTVVADVRGLQHRLEAEFEAERRRDSEILRLIAQLREVFENHFDRTWFSVIIDGMPVDMHTVREIRLLVSLTSLYPGEETLLWQGIEELETFIRTLKRFLLPVLRERLGISWLFPHRRVRDRSQYILRALVAFTLPYNLERLRHLTQKLRICLLSHYPHLAEE